jgi:hypothetical protein
MHTACQPCSKVTRVLGQLPDAPKHSHVSAVEADTCAAD